MNVYDAIDPMLAKKVKGRAKGLTGEPRILGASLRKEVYERDGSITDTALTNEASKKSNKKSVQNEDLQASKRGRLET